MKKKEAKIKGAMKLPQAIAYLDDIVSSLKAGHVTVTNGSESISLTPVDSVKVEFEAAKKEDRETISFRISWEKEATQNGEMKLRISADEAEEVNAE
jgi:amphi-Trp domain-containing protein